MPLAAFRRRDGKKIRPADPGPSGQRVFSGGSHAGDPEDFKKAIANFRMIDTVLGSPEKTVLDCELIPRREARRSLVLTRNMKAGEIICENDLMPKRPGTGIAPIYAEIVIGRCVVRDLPEDTILTWEML